MYADIGPGSFEIKKCVCAIDIQSHRVEYAQVNHGAKGKTPKLELKDQSDPTGSGNYYEVNNYVQEFGEILIKIKYQRRAILCDSCQKLSYTF